MGGTLLSNDPDPTVARRRAAARRTAAVLALVAVAFYFGIMLILAGS